jgi:type II secretory pathway predicted ATPase ExeA
MDAEPRLCLLLLGQTELRRRLTMAVHEALAQRIVVRYHIAALAREQLSTYLAQRLRLAGAEIPRFDPSAEEAIAQATGGRARSICSPTTIAPGDA